MKSKISSRKELQAEILKLQAAKQNHEIQFKQNIQNVKSFFNPSNLFSNLLSMILLGRANNNSEMNSWVDVFVKYLTSKYLDKNTGNFKKFLVYIIFFFLDRKIEKKESFSEKLVSFFESILNYFRPKNTNP